LIIATGVHFHIMQPPFRRARGTPDPPPAELRWDAAAIDDRLRAAGRSALRHQLGRWPGAAGSRGDFRGFAASSPDTQLTQRVKLPTALLLAAGKLDW